MSNDTEVLEQQIKAFELLADELKDRLPTLEIFSPMYTAVMVTYDLIGKQVASRRAELIEILEEQYPGHSADLSTKNLCP
ncbi:hypothetical protein [Pseudomonas aeruginosa]|uniref:hypothetical protein n=1 Tax=Pseudomonas aeruginosa TaxID=287 RepID=UPI003D08BBFA